MKVFCIPISKQFDAKLNGKAHGKIYAISMNRDRHARKQTGMDEARARTVAVAGGSGDRYTNDPRR